MPFRLCQCCLQLFRYKSNVLQWRSWMQFLRCILLGYHPQQPCESPFVVLFVGLGDTEIVHVYISAKRHFEVLLESKWSQGLSEAILLLNRMLFFPCPQCYISWEGVNVRGVKISTAHTTRFNDTQQEKVCWPQWKKLEPWHMAYGS